MNAFYGTHRGGTHVNEGRKNWAVQLLELVPSGSVCLFCYTVSPAGCDKTATPPTRFLIRIYPSLHSVLLSVFQQPSEISHINNSRHTIRLTTQTFPRKTDTCEGDWCCPSDRCSGYKYAHPSLPSTEQPSRQSWSHSCLNIHSLYIQFYSLIDLSTDWTNKVIS